MRVLIQPTDDFQSYNELYKSAHKIFGGVP